jgi:hypothetical protein
MAIGIHARDRSRVSAFAISITKDGADEAPSFLFRVPSLAIDNGAIDPMRAEDLSTTH